MSKVRHRNFSIATSSSSGAGFDVEGWFSPFMYKWLHQLSFKTISWVENSVKQDSFDPPDSGDDEPPHSESITYLFKALYAELEFITDIEWSNPIQNAQFFQMYAKVFFC
jgi:hypothetical protein